MLSAYQMFHRLHNAAYVAARAARSKVAEPARAFAGPLVRSMRLSMSCLLAVASLNGATACSFEEDCENQACICAEGATCDFDCVAPPCHIECREGSDCTGQCANGSCQCASDSNCSFGCDAPPCHVDCGSGANCDGTCANGDCSCGADSECHFGCQAGPCHVECGARSTCTGECSNGTCECGPDGRCEFTCKDGNCKTQCPAGAQCLLTCSAGGDKCKFDSCSGSVTECPDGRLACNRACP